MATQGEPCPQQEDKTFETIDVDMKSIVSKVSVVVNEEWINAVRCHSDINCEVFLNNIVENQKCHEIRLLPFDKTWRLEGCFCGIREIMSALEEARKKLIDVGRNQEVESNKDEKELEISSEKQMEGVDTDANDVGFIPCANDGDANNVKDIITMETFLNGNLSNEGQSNHSITLDTFQNVDPSTEGDSNQTFSPKVCHDEVSSVPKTLFTWNKSESSDQEPTAKKQKETVVTDIPNPERPDPQQDKQTTGKLIKKVKILKSKVPRNPNEESTKESNNETMSPYSDLSEVSNSLSPRRSHSSERSESIYLNSPDSPGLEHHHDIMLYDERRSEEAYERDQSDRIVALKFLPKVVVDKDVFYYLYRKFNKELSEIDRRCQTFEPYIDGSVHCVAMDVKPEENLDCVLANFTELYEQVRVDTLKIPDLVDIDNLSSTTEAMTEFRNVDLRFTRESRDCRILGLPMEVKMAKKIMQEIISPADTAGLHLKHETKVQKSHDVGNYSLDLPQCYTHFDGKGRSAFFEILQHGRDFFKFTLGSVEIEVRHGDLTRHCDSEVGVSFIDHNMNPSGQFSKKILEAGGPDVRYELDQHKVQVKYLHTANLVHTKSGGYGTKFLLHIVRPTEFEYPLDTQSSTDTLRCTFTNCIRYTNDRLQCRSLSLPVIGSGTYATLGIAECFMDAVELFLSTVQDPSYSCSSSSGVFQHLRFIQLISNSGREISQLIELITHRFSEAYG